MEKMKEQGSRNGDRRNLRRILGFRAHACRRHACGGTAPAEFRPQAGTCAPPSEYAASLYLHGPAPTQVHFPHPHTLKPRICIWHIQSLKGKSNWQALFLHMSTGYSMCAGRQNTHHLKLYPFAPALAFTLFFQAGKKPTLLFRCMHERP